ncbi:MAG: tRNA (guanosine(37)-N1)-methyltransferase TrmD [Elusimicrobiales bacterium]
MRFDVVTLFPEIVDYPLSFSIIGRARKKGLVEIGFVNPKEFAQDKHKTIDDKPYGGGSGMVLIAEFVLRAINKVRRKKSYTVLLTPRGRIFNQQIAREYSLKKHIILVCGHYEGIDDRISYFVDDEISIGDFVLSGGEIAAACIIDCVTRLVRGVIKDESVNDESFSYGLLEYPQYTRPRVWRGIAVPKVLVSGDHRSIEIWRFRKACQITQKRRPELYQRYIQEKNFLKRGSDG